MRCFAGCLLCAGLVLLAGFPLHSQEPKTESKSAADATEEIPETKKELLRLIAALRPKLPPELSRRLAVISMKIATGWCDPHLTAEFEQDLNARPDNERRRFEAEWKRVRAHEAWPRLKEEKPARESKDKT